MLQSGPDAAPFSPADLGWLITQFVGRTDGVIEAAVVSADGLLVSASDGLDGPTGDQVAAVASSINSMVMGASAIVDGGRMTQVMVHYDNGFLLLRGLTVGAVLIAVVRRGAAVGMIGHEMGVLAGRVGTHLSPQLIRQIARGQHHEQ